MAGVSVNPVSSQMRFREKSRTLIERVLHHAVSPVVEKRAEKKKGKNAP